MLGWRAGRYLLTALLLSTTAEAQSLSLTSGIDRIAGVGGAVGALSGLGLPPPGGGYGLRLLQTGYGGKVVRLRRASDNAEQDIGLVGANFDNNSAVTFCAATSCFVKIWYDQSGNAKDLVQASAAGQPSFIFDCVAAGKPCIRTTSATISMTVATNNSATSVSFSTVARRSAALGSCVAIAQQVNNRIQGSTGVAGWTVVGNAVSSLAAPTAAENVWHSISAVIQGAGSNINTDGTVVSGTVNMDSSSSAAKFNGNGTTTCDETEAVFWPNFSLTGPQQAALNTNQHLYWGF